jgi:hypothetical protein
MSVAVPCAKIDQTGSITEKERHGRTCSPKPSVASHQDRHCERKRSNPVTQRKHGLLRRFAPRNDAASTGDTTPRSRGARRPSFAKTFRPTEGVARPSREGAGNAGCSLHPQPRAQSVVEHTSVVTTSPPEHPAFPHAMVLTAYFALFSATNSFCHRHRRIEVLSGPVGPT